MLLKKVSGDKRIDVAGESNTASQVSEWNGTDGEGPQKRPGEIACLIEPERRNGRDEEVQYEGKGFHGSSGYTYQTHCGDIAGCTSLSYRGIKSRSKKYEQRQNKLSSGKHYESAGKAESKNIKARRLGAKKQRLIPKRPRRG
jgi:hypothetical protein